MKIRLQKLFQIHYLRNAMNNEISSLRDSARKLIKCHNGLIMLMK